MNATYFLFSGDDFYPDGGMNDYRGAFASIEAAQEFFLKLPLGDWGEIATLQSDGQLVKILACQRIYSAENQCYTFPWEPA